MPKKNKKLIVIKIGGSVITDDVETEKFVEERACALIDVLNDFTDKYNFIVVHGAGSFGHYYAKKYDLVKGYQSDDQLKGVSETHEAMLRLNEHLLQCFLPEENLKPLTFSPLDMCITKSGRIATFCTSAIEQALAQGFTPILFGDVVFDQDKKFAILSGDQIVPYLALNMKADKIIMCTDVDGIYDCNPGISMNAKLIKEFDVNDKELIEKIEETAISGKTRVTGEIEKKLEELRFAAKEGIDIQVISGLEPEPLKDVLGGKDGVGTKIIAK